MDDALVAEDLTVDYGAVRALDHVTVRVGRGELVSLVGPNGAGKSTLLRAVMGLVPLTTGTIHIHGRDVGREPTHRRSSLGVGMVPEGGRILSSLTVRENLALGAAAADPAIRRASTQRAVARFPLLEPLLAADASGLSGGERQALAIARCLAGEPSLLLLDEPSFGLAPRIVDDVFAAIAELRDSDLTILLVEQNARRAVQVSDRCYVLGQGHVRFEGTASGLSEPGDLDQLYLGGVRP